MAHRNRLDRLYQPPPLERLDDLRDLRLLQVAPQLQISRPDTWEGLTMSASRLAIVDRVA